MTLESLAPEPFPSHVLWAARAVRATETGSQEEIHGEDVHTGSSHGHSYSKDREVTLGIWGILDEGASWGLGGVESEISEVRL